MPKLQITINGVELTEAQSLTVHVALQSFGMHLYDIHKSMGNKWDGSVEESYMTNLHNINRIYVN